MLPTLLAFAVLAAEPRLQARKVIYHDADIIPINCQVGLICEIHFPKNEVLMTSRVGNKDFFRVNADRNVVYIEPQDVQGDGKEGGKRTTVNVISANGAHVPFLVQEISHIKGAQADLKIFVEYGDQSNIVDFHPQVLTQSSEELAAEKNHSLSLSKQLEESRQNEAQKIENAVLAEIGELDWDSYEVTEKKGKENWNASVAHDRRWTYVRIKAQDAPSLWEIKDGKPVKVEVSLQNGQYVIPKLVKELELRLGKSSVRYKIRDDKSI